MCLENYTEKNKVFKKTKLLGRVYRKKKKKKAGNHKRLVVIIEEDWR
jgi:hypothetical protein